MRTVILKVLMPAALGVIVMSPTPAFSQSAAANHSINLTADRGAAFFPILPWDWMKTLDGDQDARAGLASVKACGFTMAGFIRPQDLPACERLELAAIVAPDPPLSVQNKPIESDEELDRRVR